jgi:hypothetical protein
MLNNHRMIPVDPYRSTATATALMLNPWSSSFGAPARPAAGQTGPQYGHGFSWGKSSRKREVHEENDEKMAILLGT